MPSSHRPPKRPSYNRPPSRSGHNGRPQASGNTALKSGLYVGLGILIAVCIGFSFVAYQRADTCMNGSMRDCLGMPTPTPAVTVGGILTTIRGESKLVTAVADSETRVSMEQAETFLGFETTRTIEMEYQAYGEVMTGIDLSKISEWDVTVSNDLVTVNLPAPEILSVAIDVDRSYIANIEEPFFALSDPDPRLVDYAQEEAKQAILEDVCEQGILEEANVHAVEVLQKLLENTNPLPVRIVTQSGVCR